MLKHTLDVAENVKIPASPLPASLSATGRAMLIQGALLLILGLCLFFAPLKTVRYLTAFLGVIIIFNGLYELFIQPGWRHSPALARCNSLILVVLGVFTLWMPLVMNMIWVVILGVLSLYAGARTWHDGYAQHRSSSHVLSAMSMLIGIILILAPWTGMLAMSWLIALLLLGDGAILLTCGWKWSHRA